MQLNIFCCGFPQTKFFVVNPSITIIIITIDILLYAVYFLMLPFTTPVLRGKLEYYY